LAEIENRAEINGEGSVSRMPNICVASDTTGISTKPTGIFPLPSRFRGRRGLDGPLNHFLRENWNFRQEIGDAIDMVAIVDAKSQAKDKKDVEQLLLLLLQQ